MDFTLAHQAETMDKYLLGELSETERAGFEGHVFDCPACAAKLQQDFAMIANLKQVLREEPPLATSGQRARALKPQARWREWFRPMTLVPTFAALALASLAGYQNLFLIPGMLQPRVLDTTPIVASTRGTGIPAVTVPPSSAFLNVTFEVVTAAVHQAYVCEFLSADGRSLATVDCGKRATTEFTLSLLLPASKYPPGFYTMILRPASDKQMEMSRYSFAVKNEDR